MFIDGIVGGLRICKQCLLKISRHSLQTRWLSKSGGKTYYEILGLPMTASTLQIKAAFIEKSKKIHPDAKQDSSVDNADFIEVYNAYSVLIKPSTRRLYDTDLASGHQVNYGNTTWRMKQDAHQRREKDAHWQASRDKTGQWGEMDEMYEWSQQPRHNRGGGEVGGKAGPRILYMIIATMLFSFFFHIAFIQKAIGLSLHELFLFSFTRRRLERRLREEEAMICDRLNRISQAARENSTNKQLEILEMNVSESKDELRKPINTK